MELLLKGMTNTGYIKTLVVKRNRQLLFRFQFYKLSFSIRHCHTTKCFLYFYCSKLRPMWTIDMNIRLPLKITIQLFFVCKILKTVNGFKSLPEIPALDFIQDSIVNPPLFGHLKIYLCFRRPDKKIKFQYHLDIHMPITFQNLNYIRLMVCEKDCGQLYVLG